MMKKLPPDIFKKLADLKREAYSEKCKATSEGRVVSFNQCLNPIARREGFANWRHLMSQCKAAAREAAP